MSISEEPEKENLLKPGLVSIVSIFHNREEAVKESIQSLLNQTYENIEFIIIDDGSTDSTLEKLTSFNDPRLKVITHTNRGLTNSLVKAIELARGEFIAIHGSGDISLPTRIEKQVNILIREANIGVVGCFVENVNLVDSSVTIHKPKLAKDELHTLLQKNIFTHGEVIFRRTIYDMTGGYRSFFKYGQDYDLWSRMCVRTRFFIVEEVLYRRFKFPSGVSQSLDKITVRFFLSELVIQSLENHLKNHEKNNLDLIDRYGKYAPFFRRRTKRLSKKLRNLSVGLAFGVALFRVESSRDLSGAIRVNNLSINENKNFSNLFIGHIYRIMYKYEQFDRVILFIVAKLPIEYFLG